MIKTSKNGVYKRQLDNGAIAFIITYRFDGKSYKKTLGTDKEGWSVASAAKERILRMINQKTNDEIDCATKKLDEIANEYFLSIIHKSEYKNTINRYKNHIQEMLGNKSIDKINGNDLQKLKIHLSNKISTKTGKTLAYKTINDMLNLVHTIYSHYNKINYKYPIQSPAKKDIIDRYYVENSRLGFISKEDYSRLLDAIANRNEQTKNKNTLPHRTNEMLVYVKLLVTTGIRTYSALTIRAKDIDFKNKNITIKNHKCNRFYTVFIHPSIENDLLDICLSLKADDYIFGRSAEPLHRNTINKRLQPILNKLFNEGTSDARERIVVHSMRHTFGSWLAQQGTSLYIIAKLMDHSDISQTQMYSKLSPNSGFEDVARLL